MAEARTTVDHDAIREILATSDDLRRILNDMATEVADGVRVRMGRHTRTGAMLAKVKASVISTAGTLAGKVTVRAPANLFKTRALVKVVANKYGVWGTMPADNPWVQDSVDEVSQLWGG